MSWETVRLEIDDDVATLSIDRPDAMNALNVETLEGMTDALAEAAEEDARALVLTGSGDDAFIAGADIAHMQDLPTEEAHEWIDLGHEVADALESFPAPTVAAINGYAFGGGVRWRWPVISGSRPNRQSSVTRRSIWGSSPAGATQRLHGSSATRPRAG